MTKAIGIIQAEHRGYSAMLHCLDNLVRDIETRRTAPDFELFRLIFAYVRNFLDRCHHPKEDTYLFRTLAKRCPAAKSALVVLEGEHKIGPHLIDALVEAFEAYEEKGTAAFPAFREAARIYVDFERAHVKREETEVLPLAREWLTDEDWQKIDAAFANNDDPLFGALPQRRFQRLFSTIVALAPTPYGLGPASAATRQRNAKAGAS